MVNLDSVLKSRDITSPTKVPLVMYGCEIWTAKKAECRRIDALELWCWRTLESPLDCKEIKPINPKGNQPWIFIRRTDAEAETPTLWPKSRLMMLGNSWCWERVKARGEEDEREWDGWMASPTQWKWIWANPEKWWWKGNPGVLQSMGVIKSCAWLSDWTTTSLILEW